MRKRVEVMAVWDEDLEGLLNRLGAADDVREGTAVCSICGRYVNFDDIGAIHPQAGGGVSLICDNPDCIASVTIGTGSTETQ